jgi:hypothetical protein
MTIFFTHLMVKEILSSGVCIFEIYGMGIFSVIPHGESNGGFRFYGQGRVENTV